jgi:PKD repeat protein
VKTKKQHISLRDLFRLNLEYHEVIPSIDIKSKLMRRVARREFLRFNPARLNIYYLGGILMTGITAAALLFSGQANSPAVKPDDLTKSDTSIYLELQINQPVKVVAEKLAILHNRSIINVNDSQSFVKSAAENFVTVDSDITPGQFPKGISKSSSKNVQIGKVKVEKNILQKGFKPDAFLIDPLISEGCAPLKLRFHNTSTTYDSCRWSFGDGGYSNEKDPEWIFDVEGDYKVVLEVYNRAGKLFSSTAAVTVYPRPQAHFETAPGNAILPNDEIHFLNYSNNAVRFSWDFGDGFTSELYEPRHTYSKFNNYNIRLAVFSDWGCSDTLTVFNAFSGTEFFIDFPNAFIPNEQGPSGGYYSLKSDEAAQVFHPSYSGISEYQLKIFSKLGIPIFESSDINLGWDGYNKGQLCDPGVYIWKVRGKFRNGEPFIKMGDVTLLKN